MQTGYLVSKNGRISAPVVGAHVGQIGTAHLPDSARTTHTAHVLDADQNRISGTVRYADQTYAFYPDACSSMSCDGLIEVAQPAGTVCFLGGTLIATTKGEIPVERLRPGDLILTADNGPQPLIILAGRALGKAELAQNPNLLPIEIAGHIQGCDVFLNVSPQHSVIIDYNADQRLVTAAKLAELGVEGVRVRRDLQRVSYFHLLFDAHQIIFANGCPAESFLPTHLSVNSLGDACRTEFLTLFPDFSNIALYPDVGSAQPWDPAREYLDEDERLAYLKTFS